MISDYKKIHFIGIGGIGVSAIAKLMKAQNKEVSGSDCQSSEITDDLKKQGIKVNIGHRKKNLKTDTGLVVYSPAVPEDNPERKRAKSLGIPQLSFPQILGKLMENKFGIAVSGTHGKSTTTAILGLILDKAGLDPTVIVGSKTRSFKNDNLRIGKSDYFIAEACEWQANMLNLNPKVIILTNLEAEHLDYYKDLDDLKKHFEQYVKKLPKDGLLVINTDDPNISGLSKFSKSQVLTYGIKHQADLRAKLFSRPKHKYQILQNFKLKFRGKNLGGFTLKVPGEFNIYNASAASLCSLWLGVKPSVIKKVLSEFGGIWRRFELIEADKRGYLRGFTPKITLVSDYAHHPTEIKATLKAARDFYPGRRIVVAFQPHHYDRTRKLFKDFVKAFDKTDLLILNETYSVAGREKNTGREITKKLAEEIKKRGIDVLYTRNLLETKKVLQNKIKKGDLVLIMGAGDIYKIKIKNQKYK